MEDFFKLVANFGFPIVVSGFLLIRMEKTLKESNDKISELTDSIKELCIKLDKEK